MINVDQEEADELERKYRYEHRENGKYLERRDHSELKPTSEEIDYSDRNAGYIPGEAKSRIHKFGELYTVPTKIISEPVKGPKIKRPVRGQKMNSENISKLEFWFEMRHYYFERSSVTKKEDERNVCLDAVKSLYWRGKLNFYGVAEL